MLMALAGGVLIGLSASLAWSGAGELTGISGIVGGVLREGFERRFRSWFLVGLLLASVALGALAPASLSHSSLAARPFAWLVGSGLLVGFGTQLGSGCTSGHGVCGLSRLSLRSLLATLTFMATAALVVFLTRHVVTLAGVVR
jgi:uncharacterized membrane protein YedE/YeeE